MKLFRTFLISGLLLITANSYSMDYVKQAFKWSLIEPSPKKIVFAGAITGVSVAMAWQMNKINKWIDSLDHTGNPNPWGAGFLKAHTYFWTAVGGIGGTITVWQGIGYLQNLTKNMLKH